MMNLFGQTKSNINRNASVLGAVGLSAIALLSVAQSADAASISGPVNVKLFNYNQANPTIGQPVTTEMEGLSLSGTVEGVGSVMIRESPTKVSAGQVTITQIPGGQYRITSFFDVHTEISVDSGQNWIASENTTRMNLQEFNSSVPILPLESSQSKYLSPKDVHAIFSFPGKQIALSGIEHSGFSGVSFQQVGTNLVETAQSTVTANIGPPPAAPEPVSTMFSSVLAFGVGAWLKNAYAKKSKKDFKAS